MSQPWMPGGLPQGCWGSKRGDVPEPWMMIGEPVRTKARLWEEDDQQDQKLMQSLEQVNRSIALHCPKLQRASCSLSVLLPRLLHFNPLHLLLNQVTRCLVVNPQHKPVAWAHVLSAVAAHHLQNYTHGWQRNTFSAVPQ